MWAENPVNPVKNVSSDFFSSSHPLISPFPEFLSSNSPPEFLPIRVIRVIRS